MFDQFSGQTSRKVICKELETGMNFLMEDGVWANPLHLMTIQVLLVTVKSLKRSILKISKNLGVKLAVPLAKWAKYLSIICKAKSRSSHSAKEQSLLKLKTSVKFLKKWILASFWLLILNHESTVSNQPTWSSAGDQKKVTFTKKLITNSSCTLTWSSRWFGSSIKMKISHTKQSISKEKLFQMWQTMMWTL